jgi:hypothetical protein
MLPFWQIERLRRANRILRLTLPVLEGRPLMDWLRRNRLILLEYELEGQLALIREAIDSIEQRNQAAYPYPPPPPEDVVEEILEDVEQAPKRRRYNGHNHK